MFLRHRSIEINQFRIWCSLQTVVNKLFIRGERAPRSNITLQIVRDFGVHKNLTLKCSLDIVVSKYINFRFLYSLQTVVNNQFMRGARSLRINNLFSTVCSEYQNRKLIYFDTTMSKEYFSVKFLRAPKSLTIW
jgi:hypothetical protein